MANLCNVNGQIVREADATVPVLDRGFLFGDSVYEVMRTVAGVPFGWPEHLERLRASAGGLQLPLPMNDAEIMGQVIETLAASGLDPAYIRIIITRGTGSAPNIDLAYAPGPNNYVIMVRALKLSEATARLAIVPRTRNSRRALDPAIKSGNYLNNVMGLMEAKDQGATDCLFLNENGKVTEASTSNIYLIRDGALVTPPLSAGLLSGITRRLIKRMCEEQGLGHVEEDLTDEDIRDATDLFLSSSLRDITPVVSIDGRELHGGDVGSACRDLQERFKAFVSVLVEHEYRPKLEQLLR